jgi:hypothetical protein
MDEHAKHFLPQASPSPCHYDIKGEPWQLWVNGSKITKEIQKQLYEAVHSSFSEEYWASKPNSSPASVRLVNWRTIGFAMKTLPRTRRVFLSKHISGMCGVGKFMKRWKDWDSDRCPRCGSPEDATHVWLCKGPGTEELWSKVVAELEVTMRKLDTDPTLAHIISLYLQSWRTGEAITYEPPREFQVFFKLNLQLVGASFLKDG